jgi:hypothetical protein
MEQPAEVVPEVVQPKKKMSGWIIAIIVIVVLCCCLVVVGLIAAFAYMGKEGINNLNMDDFQYFVPMLQWVA